MHLVDTPSGSRSLLIKAITLSLLAMVTSASLVRATTVVPEGESNYITSDPNSGGRFAESSTTLAANGQSGSVFALSGGGGGGGGGGGAGGSGSSGFTAAILSAQGASSAASSTSNSNGSGGQGAGNSNSSSTSSAGGNSNNGGGNSNSQGSNKQGPSYDLVSSPPVSGGSESFKTFSVVAPVPDTGSSLALLGLAIVAIAGVKRAFRFRSDR